MLEATGDMVIVELRYKEKTGSIYIPDQAKSYGADFHGIVISIGPEYKEDLKLGDKVIVERHEGVNIEHEGKKYVSVKNLHVLAKLED